VLLHRLESHTLQCVQNVPNYRNARFVDAVCLTHIQVTPVFLFDYKLYIWKCIVFISSSSSIDSCTLWLWWEWPRKRTGLSGFARKCLHLVVDLNGQVYGFMVM